MPRFILMEVYKPPLSENKIYKEKDDNLNLMYGYGVDHNIILYEETNEYIKEVLKSENTVSKSMVKITVEREVYNIKDIYNFLRKTAISSGKVKDEDFPKYSEVKGLIYRKIYDKETGDYLYTTDSFFLGNSPKNKYNKNIESSLFIGGIYNEEIKCNLEDVVEVCKGRYCNHPLIKTEKVNYYALCCDTVYIEDNMLNIFPYEYSKYLPGRDGLIDKFYKVKALEAIGLTEEISSRWIEGKSVLSVLIGDEENNVEECVFPPDSFNYGVSGPNDEWDGENDSE